MSIQVMWLSLIQVIWLNIEHSLPFDRVLMKPSKLWLINDFKTLWSGPLQISTLLFLGIGVWLILLRCNSRQTGFSQAPMKANLFQCLLILLPEEAGLLRCKEDGSSVKRHFSLWDFSWCLQASWAAPKVPPSTSKASDGQGFLQLKQLRSMDGTSMTEKGRNCGGNQNRERGAMLLLSHGNPREPCSLYPSSAGQMDQFRVSQGIEFDV